MAENLSQQGRDMGRGGFFFARRAFKIDVFPFTFHTGNTLRHENRFRDMISRVHGR